MNIFLDTNFLLDFFIRDEYLEVCSQLLRLSHERGDRLFISFLSVANFAYVIRKTPDLQKSIMITKLCSLFSVIDNTHSQIQKALQISAHDFEDVLQYQTALDGGCNVIITRNQKDFKFSDIPVLSASEYLIQIGVENRR